MAVEILTAQGLLKYDHLIFANVGDDSENPGTLKYVEEYCKPYAREHNLDFIELQRTRRNGETETLLNRIMTTLRGVPLPAWMKSGAPGNRTCTLDFKIRVVNKWLKQHGATRDNKAVTGIGISLDEWTRARDSREVFTVLEYPLLDKRLSRLDCQRIILDAGLPVPPKSSCYFCPFHRQKAWEELKRDEPELFDKAVEIDEHVRNKRLELGKDEVYLHFSGRPLKQAVGLQYKFDLYEDDLPCDTGNCMT